MMLLEAKITSKQILLHHCENNRRDDGSMTYTTPWTYLPAWCFLRYASESFSMAERSPGRLI